MEEIMNNLSIGEIQNACKGKLLCGNKAQTVEGFSRDSRTVKNGDLYIGIKGENFDGNNYYIDAIENGAMGCILEEHFEANINKEDIKDKDLQKKLEDAIKKYKYQLVKFDKIEVTKQGEFEGIGQKIPYAKINVEISNLPVKDMDGIVGVAELENGKNLIIISVNEKGKYSQIITEAFYKKVKNV